jgi:hypothetical protein
MPSSERRPALGGRAPGRAGDRRPAQQREVALGQQEQPGRGDHRQHDHGREEPLSVQDDESLQNLGSEVGEHGDRDDERDLPRVLDEGQGQPAGRDHPAG